MSRTIHSATAIVGLAYRKTRIQLTPEGRTLRDTLQGCAATVLERALYGIADAQIEVLRSILQSIKAI